MEKSIFKTVVYYDCLDYPLSLEELKIFSFSGFNDFDFFTGLKTLKEKRLIEESGGFYFLKGHNDLIKIRTERNRLAGGKWRKALKAARWLCLVPYVRLIFASGSLALSNTDKDSDLDVLLVVKHGRIWLARFLTVLLLSLLGVRRTRYEKIAPDKICLNHFITDKSLYIPRKSIYTAQLYARLVPIFVEDEKLLDDFCEANSWVKEYIPKFPISKADASVGSPTASRRGFQFPNNFQVPQNNTIVEKCGDVIKKFSENILNTKLGDWLENILRKYQLRRIKSYHLTYKSGGRVKADNESLEFHPDSPEWKIIEKYNRTMIKLGFPELGKERDSGLLHNDKK